MKLIVLLMTVAILQISAATRAQNITMKKDKASLEQVIKEIRQQSGYDFFYNLKLIQKAIPVTINIKNMPLEEALKKVFENQPLTYTVTIAEKAVVVKEKNASAILEKIKGVLVIPVKVSGKVTDTAGTVLPGATISIKGQNRVVQTDIYGNFTFLTEIGTEVTISFVGFKPYTFKVVENLPFQNITLYAVAGKLEEVVVVNTGYQTLSKERITGAFEKINSTTIDRAVSSDILSRLDGNFSALSNNNGALGGRTIRGINSISGSSSPLIVVDNFPYGGDLANINPNDVESVVLLKDAAASSIWGATAGNGVLVITTKKGKYNQKTNVTFNSNVTMITKPDLFKNQRISTSDYIDLEKYLFSQGAYDGDFANTYSYPIISPVVQILQKQKDNQISKAEADAQINLYRNNDVRNDLEKYLYRNSVNQQYSLGISSGSDKFNFRTSIGFDKNLYTLVGNEYNRVSFNSILSYSPIKNLEITGKTTLTQSTTINNSIGESAVAPGSRSLYPYERLVDANDNPVSFPKYNSNFYSIPGSDKLLDWSYNPLNELKLADNTGRLKDVLMSFNIKYRIIPSLSASIDLQRENQIDKSTNYHSPNSFYTRDKINIYTTVDGAVVDHGIPLGGIIDNSDRELISNSARGQLNFDKTFSTKHQISILVATDIQQQTVQTNNSGSYGYDPDILTTISTDYFNPKSTFNNMFGTINVPDPVSYSETLKRGVSFLGNASYSFDNRYIVSGSIRKDESNLFGVKTNQKGLPLYSVGFAWNVIKENFFNFPILTDLKLRGSIGSGGNINNQVAAITTLGYVGNSRYYGLPSNQITNYPNPELKYEQVNTKNIGIDFAVKNDILSGSIDFYSKKSIDLISPVTIDMTSGIAVVVKNTADLTNKGFDLTLNSLNINNTFKWRSSLTFEKNKSTVSEYKYDGVLLSSLVGQGNQITPIVGFPPYNLITFKFAGLDPLTGDPLGYHNGQISKDYQAIQGETTWDDVTVHGSTLPTVFGSLRNTFEYKNFSASFTIGYRFNYFFLRNDAIYYSRILGGGILPTQQEFAKRWQKPGDELKTNVPSMNYPFDSSEDSFYATSDVQAEKADNIRLNDIRLSYTFKPFKGKINANQSITISGYASNLGILWKATKSDLDPDTRSAIPTSKAIAFGCKFNF